MQTKTRFLDHKLKLFLTLRFPREYRFILSIGLWAESVFTRHTHSNRKAGAAVKNSLRFAQGISNGIQLNIGRNYRKIESHYSPCFPRNLSEE
jgi:hypothetical protein